MNIKKIVNEKLTDRTRNLWLFLAVLLMLTACSAEPSMLNPAGEGAIHIANLWWIMLIIGAAVYIEVMVLLVVALFRRRILNAPENGPPDVRTPSRRARNFIVVNGIAIPILILTAVFGFNLNTLVNLSPPDTNNLIIEVIGHRWWWEVRYPHHNVVTANEIYIPTGQAVELRMTSVDVIHSLWIPALNGKTDLIPGQSNRMYLQTERAGEYRGQCTELCGVQHAKMGMLVIALTPAEFDQWITTQQLEAPIPSNEVAMRGQQIFLGAACVYCHTVRGTTASGVIGPDLTHIASRRTLGANALPNTRGNLAGWIIDPQSIKPGNEMPPIYLEADDLQALLTYLETLQ